VPTCGFYALGLNPVPNVVTGALAGQLRRPDQEPVLRAVTPE
jgi:hypothetical protein